MLRRASPLFFLCALVALLATSVAAAPRKYDVYFVSVGSADQFVPADGSLQFLPLPGAKRSARYIANELMQGGARNGIIVTSDPIHLISSHDIRAAILRVEAEITADRAANPLFVFYVASHGIADGFGWNHFIIPGNFAYDGDLQRLSVDKLSEAALYTGDVADLIGKAHVPYIMMLDTCYDGKAQVLTSSVLTQIAQRNIQDVAAIVRAINEYRQSSPVLFSVKPGEDAKTVPDPAEPSSTIQVAPLERRFFLAFDAPLRAGKAITVRDFVRAMTSPNLDAVTPPAVTNAELDAGADVPFLTGGTPYGHLELLTGTAVKPVVCCKN